MNVRATTMSFDYGRAFNEMKQFIGADMERELRIAEKEISERILKSAKEDHRYQHRTKNLRDATKVEGHINSKVKNGLRVYVDLEQAPYAKYVIRGHGTWALDPFIDNAIETNKQWIFARLQLAIDKAIKAQNRKK
jgi:hypothetical protein